MIGKLFVISAPSGTGKTTILKRVMAGLERITFSVSHTTRKARPGEDDGVDYHFVEHRVFVAMREAGAFLEWASVHDNLYGTSRKAVEDILAGGTDVILDIDVQGARQVKMAHEIEAVLVFIVPPSWQELEARLRGRGTDSPATIELRCKNARQEIGAMDMYDYVIVNENIDEAVAMLGSIIVAERSRSRRSTSGKPYVLPDLLSHE